MIKEEIVWNSVSAGLPPSRTEVLFVDFHDSVYNGVYVEGKSKVSALQRFELEDAPSIPATHVKWWALMPKGPQC